MKFAFLIMGNFDPIRDRVHFEDGNTWMVGVSSLREACREAQALAEQGVSCIELCGAFGETGAKAVIEATGGKLPVGYVVHLPEQDPLFDAVFGAN